MPRRALSLGLGLAALLSLGSCLTVDYDRFRRYEPVPAEAWAELVPGESSLTDCLASLGAPLRVWEPRPGALALAWVWVDRTDWGLSVSVPTGEAADASFSYREMAATDEGLLLVFDEDWLLESLERGMVGELDERTTRARLVD